MPRLVTLAGISMLGVLLIWLASPLASDTALPPDTDDPVFGSFVPAPENLEELVGASDMVLVGTIKDFVKQVNEGPYNESEFPEEMQPLPRLPFAYYELLVDSVASSRDPSVRSGDTVTLRVNGNHAEGVTGGFLMPRVGDRSVYVLTEHPDGSYGAGPWREFDVSGAQTRFRDIAGTSVESLTSDARPEEFLAELAAAHSSASMN